MRSFLGLIGYYRRFIPNFARITSPFSRCTRKGAVIDPTNANYKECFEKCKQLLCNSPVLQYPDFSKPFVLTTDASNIAIGSVLSQNNHSISYYSRTLNSAEQNYSTIERELLAILDSCKHFRPYLYGQKFTVESDHNPLVWIYKIKDPTSRLARWRLKLEDYNFDVKYRKGKENQVADCLSRVQVNVLSSSSICVEPPDNFDLDEFLEDFEKNQSLSDDTNHTAIENPISGIPISEDPINSATNQILIVPNSREYDIIYRKCFNKHRHTVTLTDDWKMEISDALKNILRPNEKFALHVPHEFRPFICEYFKKTFDTTVKVIFCNKLLQDIEEEQRQIECVKQYHTENHNGIVETYKHLKNQFYWPSMQTTISNFINQCEICLKNKYERHPYKLPQLGPLLGQKPFDIIHIDLFHCNKNYYLTIVDSFSKYAQCYKISDKTSVSILSKLRHYFSHHNYPKKIVCDNGTEFNSAVIKEFMKLHKIEIHFTTVNNSSSNSPVERFHSTLIEKLRTLREQNPEDPLDDTFTHAILIYNQSIHSATNFSPFSILYGPYAEEIHFDFDLPVYETYNQRHKDELQPFITDLYNKQKEKRQKILDKQNEKAESIPVIDPSSSLYVTRRKHRPKLSSPYSRLYPKKQNKTKIIGKTNKQNTTSTHLKFAKRLRNVKKRDILEIPSLQDDPIPGTSHQDTRNPQ